MRSAAGCKPREMLPARQSLQVAEIRAEARDVLLVELRAPDGARLPPFTPGAHLELVLPDGLIRHYSLANDCREHDRYLIGIGRASESRGGSVWLHRELRCGMRLAVAGPVNNFALDPAAGAYRLIAGGIGITPIMSMARWCVAEGRPWRLHYTARSRQRAAFYEELRGFGPGHVGFHFDDEAGRVPDCAALLSDLRPDEQVYCCGPAPLMEAVRRATAHLPPGAVRFEYFTAPAATEAPQSVGFQVELRRSGRCFDIPPGRSILEVLEANGIDHPFSCREGLCRTCETRVCEGEIEHRDFALSEAEQAAGNVILVCVSRARAGRLVLDL